MKIRGTSVKRLEKSYTGALASLGAPKNICGALEGISQILLRNLESRIEWKINDAAARNPRQPVSLTEEMAELGRIAAINTALANPHLDGHRTGDPGAGAAAIVRILQLAREEYSNAKEPEKPKGGEDKVSPEAGEDEAGDESRQTTTPEGHYVPSTDSHRRNSQRRG